MDINFFLVQGIGVLAWLVLVASYYGKNTDKILAIHVVSSILYCIHYYLLGAYSGVLICAFEALRDFLYYIPYAVLGAMTLPYIFYAGGSVASSAVGFVAALFAAYFKLPLLPVAAISCICAYITSVWI
jgi:hypothetical protein